MPSPFFLAGHCGLPCQRRVFMLRKSDAHSDEQRSKNMARALTVRVLLSVVLFVCLLLAWKLGYIQPTGLPVSR